MTLRIFVEGGAPGSIKARCREGFSTFFGKVAPHNSFTVMASGSRLDAYHDFCLAIGKDDGHYNVLLVDSEELVTRAAWAHLAARRGDGWRRPAGARDDQAQLMAQVMEAWFIADREALASYYGNGFTAGSIPRRANVELVSKDDVYDELRRASRNTKTKGEYHKTRHGFDLLRVIDPAKVRRGSAHAERLFVLMESRAVARALTGSSRARTSATKRRRGR